MPSSRLAARTPDTLCMLVALAGVGIVITITGAVPTPIEDLTTPLGSRLWAAGFTLSALLALAGLLHRDPLTGWWWEAWGRAGLSLTALGYVVALADWLSQWGTSLAIALVAGVVVSSAWRAVQVSQRLRAVRAQLRGQG